MMQIKDIQEILPHRYPFLMIDRVLEVEEGVNVRGLKNFTINEPYFSGHFPNEPIVPAALILEAMSQLAGIMVGRKKLMGFLSSIYKARFFKPVVPGDQLHIAVEVTQRVRNLVRIKAHAEVDGKKVASAEMGYMVFLEEDLRNEEVNG